MWLTIILAIIVIYLLWELVTHGPLFTVFVALSSTYFRHHPEIGKALGIKYYRSDTWETTREHARLYFPSFGLFSLLGLGFESGNLEHIKDLKARQQQYSRRVDLEPSFSALLEKRINLIDLEDFLMRAWFDELLDIYKIPPPENKETCLAAISVFRAFLVRVREGFFPALMHVWTNGRILLTARQYLTTLKMPERVILLASLLTTVDASVFNLVMDPDPIKEFCDIFKSQDTAFIPFKTKDGMAFCEIVKNDSNTPGNSVFGPKGVLCPGNQVTSMMLKSFADLKSLYKVTIEGKPVRKPSSRMFANPESIFITFHSVTEPVELVQELPEPVYHPLDETLPRETSK